MQGFRSVDATKTLFTEKNGDIFHVDFDSLVFRLKEPKPVISPTCRNIHVQFPAPVDVKEM